MSDATARTSDAHADSAIHQKWVANYRTPDMQAFYEMAFDMIARHLNAPVDSTILDAGCGTCAKSVLLAARGFRVTASDYSSSALELAADTDNLGTLTPKKSFDPSQCHGLHGIHISFAQDELRVNLLNCM